jgi:DNA-binding Lrp family transcriptional regulator
MNTTDQRSLATLEALAHDGVVAISSRHLAEHVGRSKETASKSLWRLIGAGHIERVKAGRGVQSARYRVLSSPGKPVQNPDNNKPPSEGGFEGVRDLFRSQDLYGAGCLFEAAPKGVPLTVAQVIDLGVTRSRGGVMAQLVKLESLPVPLVSSQPDPSHRQRKLWTFHELTVEAETMILVHLEDLEGRLRPRYRWEQEMQHLNEQEINRERLGLEPYAVIANRDILPCAVENPHTGCLFFFDSNEYRDDYGRLHPEYMGIGAHRIVWIAERGPIPGGHDLHHDCGVRPCVNLAHLRVVTEAEHRRIHATETPAQS